MMADKTTFIKIDRNIVEWRWFKDSKVYHVFSWLLINANVKDHDFRQRNIPRGSLATSYESIANACGLSVSSVRRVIANLEQTHEIERTVRDHYQEIKVVNYDEYQGCSQRTAKQQPVEQPVEHPNSNNIRIYKKDKNVKNIPPKSPKGDSPPSDKNTSHLRLAADEGTADDIPDRYKDMFDNFADYWRYRNQ